jgi:UDP-N-acetylglucosamine 2-epimerase (non-hydrolysing)
MNALVELAASVPIVFPIHPRTESRLTAAGVHADHLAQRGITLSSPLSYLEFLGLEANAQFVLTDSGGVQEETSALGVRCFTLRDTTERPVTVEYGTNVMLGMNPDRIRTIPALLQDDQRSRDEIPLWDGRAGERAADVIADFLASTPAT